MERFVALVPDRQPTIARQPGQCPLHDPALPSQPLPILDAAPRDPVGDAPLREGRAACRIVIAEGVS